MSDFDFPSSPSPVASESLGGKIDNQVFKFYPLYFQIFFRSQTSEYNESWILEEYHTKEDPVYNTWVSIYKVLIDVAEKHSRWREVWYVWVFTYQSKFIIFHQEINALKEHDNRKWYLCRHPSRNAKFTLSNQSQNSSRLKKRSGGKGRCIKKRNRTLGPRNKFGIWNAS